MCCSSSVVQWGQLTCTDTTIFVHHDVTGPSLWEEGPCTVFLLLVVGFNSLHLFDNICDHLPSLSELQAFSTRPYTRYQRELWALAAHLPSIFVLTLLDFRWSHLYAQIIWQLPSTLSEVDSMHSYRMLPPSLIVLLLLGRNRCEPLTWLLDIQSQPILIYNEWQFLMHWLLD